jgi:hypothetical protein
VSALRLNVRRDLVEARRLYARHGYREVRPFSDGHALIIDSERLFPDLLPFPENTLLCRRSRARQLEYAGTVKSESSDRMSKLIYLSARREQVRLLPT